MGKKVSTEQAADQHHGVFGGGEATCWSTVLTVRVIECAELLAADLFKNADQTRQRITFGDVERYLARLPGHPRDCGCGRCPLAPLATPARVYAIASVMAATRSERPR